MMNCTISPSKQWQNILRTNIRSIEELISFLTLEEALQQKLLFHSTFPINIPKRIAAKIKQESIESDPIFRQFIPLLEEKNSASGFSLEPVLDSHFKKSGKLLQKYEKRALLITTGACAMNCRFCFRQNYPYQDNEEQEESFPFEQEIEYIRSKSSSLDEIILSGGDPLSLSNRSLANLFSKIESLTHIKRIRIHTRFPIGIPERIDDQFCSLLSSSTKQIIFVLHINHTQELDHDIVLSMQKIARLGIPIISQTVLLKGVNDSIDALVSLMTELGNIGIMPYYLHQLDRVIGTHHFEVPIEKGKLLVEEMKKRLSGYLVPRYVQEIPGKSGKTIIF